MGTSHCRLRGVLADDAALADGDLIEEYGRHTGHADLIREAVDGRVGEDPPAGWSAASGSFGQGR